MLRCSCVDLRLRLLHKPNITFKALASHTCSSKGLGMSGGAGGCGQSPPATTRVPRHMQYQCPSERRPEALPKHNEANKVNRGHLAFAWSDSLSNTWGFGVFSSKSHMAALNLERRQTDGTKGSLPKPHISVVLDNWVLKCWSLPYPF